MEQRTEEWRQTKLAKITGTRFAAAAGSRKTRCGLIDTLIKELGYIDGVGGPSEQYNSRAMERGTVLEAQAVASYAFTMFGIDDVVKRPAFIYHPTLPYVGCSPDFLVMKPAKILGEVKCREEVATHMQARYTGVPNKDRYQVMGNTWVCEADFAHYVGYHPGANPKDKLIILPVARDEKLISLIEESCQEIWFHVERRTKPEEKLISIPTLF